MTNTFDHFIFDEYQISGPHLALYRISYASFFLLYGVPTYGWIADNPDAFFSPPLLSISIFFDGFPDPPLLQFLSLLIAALFVFLLFGYFTRTVSLILPFVIIFCDIFAYSFGKIDHDLILWLIPLCLSFAGWGNYYSVDSKRKVGESIESWPVSLVALLLGFAFFTAGYQKFAGGWLDFETQATKYYTLQSEIVFQRGSLLGDWAITMIPDIMWELLDYATVLFEASFLLAIIKRKYFRLFIIAAILFHISVFLFMSITTTWLFITYLLFIDWATLSQKSSRLFAGCSNNYITIPIFLAFAACYIALISFGLQSEYRTPIKTISPLSMLTQWVGIGFTDVFGITTITLGFLALICITYRKSWSVRRN